MIYLDHHATTPVDPEVVAAMLPWLTTDFGNPHSRTHSIGRRAAQACDEAMDELAAMIGGESSSIVVTSGATESNNLALDGFARHPRQRRRHIITSAAEHPAVLDPLRRLERDGFRVTVLPVARQGGDRCGTIDLGQLGEALSDDTAIVSIMWANNEIGTIEQITEIAALAHGVGAVFHTDATQALGRLPLNVAAADIDLLSGSAHKFYGPKGIGFLYVNAARRRVRLRPLLEGGGQQRGLRSGTLNTPGLIGMATALRVALRDRENEQDRQQRLRDDLWQRLAEAFPGIELNGPPLRGDIRLAGNLNVSLADIEGETLMVASPEVAISSGAACSSVDPRPSHVLTAIGLSESRARRSLRFGLGRMTESGQVESTIGHLAAGRKKVLGH